MADLGAESIGTAVSSMDAENPIQNLPEETSVKEPKEEKRLKWSERRAEKKKALEDENPIAISTTRSEHTNVGGAGERFDHTKKSEPKDRVIPTEGIGIRTSVVEAHKIFLKEHLKQHLELRNANVLNPEYHGDELALMDAFVKEDGKIDEDLIDKFAKTDEGTRIIEQLLAKRTYEELLVFGLQVSAAYNDETQSAPDTRTVINVGDIARVFEGRRGGMRRRSANLVFGRTADRRAGLKGAVAGAIPGGIVGTVIGGNYKEIGRAIRGITEWSSTVGGMLWGAAGGALGGFQYGRRFLSENGDFDLGALKDGMTVIKNSGQVEYFARVYGIDVNEFTVREGAVHFRQNINPADRLTNVTARMRDIRERLDTMAEFYRNIGVPIPESRAVPGPNIGPNLSHAEQVDTIWAPKIKDAYDNVIEEFRAQGLRITQSRRLEAHMRAQRQVLGEYLQDYLEFQGMNYEGGKWTHSAGSVTEIERAKNDPSRDVNRQKAEIDGLKKALVGGNESDENDSQTQIKRLEGVLESLASRSDLSVELDDEFQDILTNYSHLVKDNSKINSVEDLITAIRSQIRSKRIEISGLKNKPDRELKKAEKKLDEGPSRVDLGVYKSHLKTKERYADSISQAKEIVENGPLKVEHDRIQAQINIINHRLESGTLDDDARSGLQTQLLAYSSNVNYRNYENAFSIVTEYEEAEKYFSDELSSEQRGTIRDYERANKALEESEGVEKSEKKLKEELDALHNAEVAIRAKQKETEAKQRTLDKQTEDIIRPQYERIEADYRALSEMGIPDEQLATSSVGEILMTVNMSYDIDEYYRYKDPQGWRKEDNLIETNLSRVINAMVHARYKLQHGDIYRSTVRLRGVLENINTPEELASLGKEEIMRRVNKIFMTTGEGWPPTDNPDHEFEIIRALEYGMDEDILRERAIKQLISDIRTEDGDLSRLKTDIDTGEVDKMAGMTINLRSSQSELFNRTHLQYRDPRVRPILNSQERVRQDDNRYPTAQEREFNNGNREIQAYYEILNNVFQYKKESDRGLAFYRASRLLPPDQLAEIIRNYFGLSVKRHDLRRVMRGVDVMYERGQINERHMRAVMQHIIDHVHRRTLQFLS